MPIVRHIAARVLARAQRHVAGATLTALLVLALAGRLAMAQPLASRPAGRAATQPTRPWKLDANVPGGNIRVVRIEGDTAHLAPDLRDTKGWWFYWYFRVRGAGGRTLHFVLEKPTCFAALGPAVSDDGGKTWRWLGAKAVQGSAFTYRFPVRAKDVRFSMGMPYTQANLRGFLAGREGSRDAGTSGLKVETHARTRKGRRVIRLRFGRLDGRETCRVFLSARHHACEMMANYVLEGVMDAVLADDPAGHGAWLREHVQFAAVPFADTDGVEDGDQGKNRKPHDHNRDYRTGAIYPSVRATRAWLPSWAGGKLRIAIDLHCPYIRGGGNEHIFFVGGPSQEHFKRMRLFGRDLQAVTTGSLRYTGRYDVPHGTSWNKTAVGPCAKWLATIPGVEVAGTIEFPYAQAGGKPVTPQTARTFGRTLARAVHRYLARPAN